MVADALSFAVSVASLLGIRHRETREFPEPPEFPKSHESSEGDAPKRPGLWGETAAGIRFVMGHAIIRKTVACSGTVNLFGSMAGAVQIIFLIRVLHVDPAYTGLFFALASLGGISGGLLSGRTARWIGSARIIWFSLLVFGLPQILSALARPGWSVALFPLGFAVSFFSIVTYNIAVVTYRQVICPPQLLGARHGDRHPPDAVDRVRRHVGGRLLDVLLPAAPHAGSAALTRLPLLEHVQVADVPPTVESLELHPLGVPVDALPGLLERLPARDECQHPAASHDGDRLVR
jgi:hypothetical protein